jgi:hypothetical protein
MSLDAGFQMEPLDGAWPSTTIDRLLAGEHEVIGPFTLTLRGITFMSVSVTFMGFCLKRPHFIRWQDVAVKRGTKYTRIASKTQSGVFCEVPISGMFDIGSLFEEIAPRCAHLDATGAAIEYKRNQKKKEAAEEAAKRKLEDKVRYSNDIIKQLASGDEVIIGPCILTSNGISFSISNKQHVIKWQDVGMDDRKDRVFLYSQADKGIGCDVQVDFSKYAPDSTITCSSDAISFIQWVYSIRKMYWHRQIDGIVDQLASGKVVDIGAYAVSSKGITVKTSNERRFIEWRKFSMEDRDQRRYICSLPDAEIVYAHEVLDTFAMRLLPDLYGKLVHDDCDAGYFFGMALMSKRLGQHGRKDRIPDQLHIEKIQRASPPNAAPVANTAVQRMTLLKEMLDKGTITQADYEKKKSEILKEL